MMTLAPIARFRSPFGSKFGIPKQAGLVEELRGTVVFEPQYRNADYIRGIEGFDFLWIVWEFSASRRTASPVVRPPVLGGNEKVGVFATRSPFRPNPIGLSSVRLERVEWESADGPLLHVCGADLMDGTPIYDIKPYLEYADCHAGARSGFAEAGAPPRLEVTIPEEVAAQFAAGELAALRKVLALDPRPRYHDDPEKVYGMEFCSFDVHFQVDGRRLKVLDASAS